MGRLVVCHQFSNLWKVERLAIRQRHVRSDGRRHVAGPHDDRDDSRRHLEHADGRRKVWRLPIDRAVPRQSVGLVQRAYGSGGNMWAAGIDRFVAADVRGVRHWARFAVSGFAIAVHFRRAVQPAGGAKPACGEHERRHGRRQRAFASGGDGRQRLVGDLHAGRRECAAWKLVDRASALARRRSTLFSARHLCGIICQCEMF